jgi:hypothetical protein
VIEIVFLVQILTILLPACDVYFTKATRHIFFSQLKNLCIGGLAEISSEKAEKQKLQKIKNLMTKCKINQNLHPVPICSTLTPLNSSFICFVQHTIELNQYRIIKKYKMRKLRQK